MARLFRKAPDAIAETLFPQPLQFLARELRKTEYPEETRQGFATPQDALVALAKEGEQRRYPNGMQAACSECARQGARHHRRAQIRAVLSDRPRHRALCAIERHSVPGPRLGGEFRDLLLPRHHRGRSREGRSPVRALRLRRTARAARHRRRFRARAARGGHPVHLQNNMAASTPGLPPPSSAIAAAAPSARSARSSACPTTPSARSPARSGAGRWPACADKEARRAGLDPSDPRLQQVMALAQELMGFPRHLSQHVGGFAITRSRLDEVVPIENAAMEDRTVIEWDKDDLNDLGLLKVDVLGLGMLSCLRRAFDLLRIHYGKRVRCRSSQAGRRRQSRDLPHDLARRHHRRVPDREPGADVDAAAAAAGEILRSRHRGRDRAAGTDPGQHGASLSAAREGCAITASSRTILAVAGAWRKDD